MLCQLISHAKRFCISVTLRAHRIDDPLTFPQSMRLVPDLCADYIRPLYPADLHPKISDDYS